MRVKILLTFQKPCDKKKIACKIEEEKIPFIAGVREIHSGFAR